MVVSRILWRISLLRHRMSPCRRPVALGPATIVAVNASVPPGGIVSSEGASWTAPRVPCSAHARWSGALPLLVTRSGADTVAGAGLVVVAVAASMVASGPTPAWSSRVIGGAHASPVAKSLRAVTGPGLTAVYSIVPLTNAPGAMVAGASM